MKKVLTKLKRKKAEPQAPSRITNETVAEHREKILAGGRKFKYPHQYVRHKLVITALAIAAITLLILGIIGWWQLYVVQNTSEFMYRLTRVVAVPVASVDGEQVRYSDYLMRYRSQELWLTTKGQMNLKDADGERQLGYIKRNVLDGVIADAYAAKQARALGVSVNGQDVQLVIDSNRNTATGRISQEVYDASTKDTLGYSPDEYKQIIKQSLIRQRVAYAVDTTADKLQKEIAAKIAASPTGSLKALADSYAATAPTVAYGASGLVQKNNQDGGLSQTALGLKDNEVSKAFRSTTGDGYYFIRRISQNDRQVNYEFIVVKLTVFDEQVAKLKKSGKVKEYISVKEVKQQNGKG
jgi:hypothetical protein